MKKFLKNLHSLLFPEKERSQMIDEVSSYVVRTLHSDEYSFTLEEQTEVIALIQKKQFQVLENKASAIEEIQNEMDNLTILSVND